MKGGCNIVEVIRRETAPVQGNTAIVDGTIGVSYGALSESVEAVARALARTGVKPLDRVAFLGEDSADYIIGSLAILQVGAVVVPVSPSQMGDELDSVLNRMDVHFLLADTAVGRELNGEPLGRCGFVARDFLLVRRLVRNEFPADYARLNPAFIRFSSGTTGTSKGVLLSHETLVARTDAADAGLRITPADTVIWVLSMSFHFVVTILLYLRRGATVVICRQPFPESFLEAAQRQRGTVFYASPFHYQVLATSPLVPAECLVGVRLAVSTAMKLGPETAGAFRAKFGFALTEAYGIIELGLPFINGAAQPGYEIKITSPGADGAGVILIRGPGMFDAYVSPWKARTEALPDGWFNTGDVGRVDEGGALTILGRKKAVINFVGMKIFPEEVEAVLASHPAVRDCRVSGESHPLFGQIPVAEVVLDPGAAAPQAGELRRFCFERLAAHKVPKEFRFVAHLDRTASGKIRRAT